MIEAIEQVAGGAQPAGDRALDQTSQAAVGGRLTGEEQHAACFDAAPRPSDGLDGRRESNVKTAAQRFGDLVEPVDHDNFTARVPAGAIEDHTGDVEGPAVATNHLFQPCGSERSLVVGEVCKGIGDGSGVCQATAELPFDDPRRWRAVTRQAGGIPSHATVNHVHVGVESVRCGTDSCRRNEFNEGLVVRRVDDLRTELDGCAGGHPLGTDTPTDAVACFENGDAQASSRKGLGTSKPRCTGADDRYVRRVHGTQYREPAR